MSWVTATGSYGIEPNGLGPHLVGVGLTKLTQIRGLTNPDRMTRLVINCAVGNVSGIDKRTSGQNGRQHLFLEICLRAWHKHSTVVHQGGQQDAYTTET